MQAAHPAVNGMSITFWGTGDSMGVPRVYCECPVCTESRDTGRNRRMRSLVHLQDPSFGSVLIDCGPDWREQMEKANMRHIDRMLLTHAHFDHIAGLAEWADSCRWLQKRGSAYARQEVIAEVQARFPWLSRNIDFTPIGDEALLGKWRIAAWKVNHGKNGFSFAFRFDHREENRSWVYCPDAIDLTEAQLEPMKNADLLVLGASFYEEPYAKETRSVYDVKEACALLQLLQPKRMILTHMSHDIDIAASYPLPENVRLAGTGMRVTV